MGPGRQQRCLARNRPEHQNTLNDSTGHLIQKEKGVLELNSVAQMNDSARDNFSSVEFAQEAEEINSAAHLQREINPRLSVSWNGQKSPGPADHQPPTQLFLSHSPASVSTCPGKSLPQFQLSTPPSLCFHFHVTFGHISSNLTPPSPPPPCLPLL